MVVDKRLPDKIGMNFYFVLTPQGVTKSTPVWQTMAFCSIVWKFIDSKSLFVDLEFDTSTTQIR